MPRMEHELLSELFEFKARKGDFKKREIILATIDCIAELGVEITRDYSEKNLPHIFLNN
jgi:hypothetical protein